MNKYLNNEYSRLGFLLFSIILIIGPTYVSGLEQKIFENKDMGVRFSYPSNWEFGFAGIMPESCQYLACSQELIRLDDTSFGNEYGDSGGLRIMMV